MAGRPRRRAARAALAALLWGPLLAIAAGCGRSKPLTATQGGDAALGCARWHDVDLGTRP